MCNTRRPPQEFLPSHLVYLCHSTRNLPFTTLIILLHPSPCRSLRSMASYHMFSSSPSRLRTAHSSSERRNSLHLTHSLGLSARHVFRESYISEQFDMTPRNVTSVHSSSFIFGYFFDKQGGNCFRRGVIVCKVSKKTSEGGSKILLRRNLSPSPSPH